MGLAEDLVYIVLFSLLGGAVAWRFGQPLIVGYILAGVVIGPNTGGWTVSATHEIEKLAEIGVALLLFALGLQFSLGELRRLYKIVFIATPIQMVLSTAGGYGIGRLLGMPFSEAIWFGTILSISSTMVVLKCLAARDGQHSEHGRVMLGVLIAQDLAIIPMMLILPQVSADTIHFGPIAIALIESMCVLALMYMFGIKIFPRVFSIVASCGSRELFLVFTLAVALGIGMATHTLGLSFAMGAFVAGLLLSETDFNHQALGDIASLRDIFGLLFFVSVGMLFNPVYLYDNIGTVLLVLSAIIACKSFSAGLAVRFLGIRNATPWLVGLGLSQVGEFAFLLTQTGVAQKAISPDTQSLIISVAVLSMVLTPELIPLGDRLYRGFLTVIRSRKGYKPPQLIRTEKREHVIVIGAGVVGKFVTSVLEMLKIDHVLIDSDFSAVAHLRDGHSEVIFGDASHEAILEASNLAAARLVILTITDPQLTLSVLAQVRSLSATVPVVVRVQEMETAAEVMRYHASEIVQPQREAAIELLRYSLLTLGFSDGKVFHLLQQVRAQSISLTGKKDEKIGSLIKNFESGRLLDITLHEVTPLDGMVNQTIAELKVRERFGLTVAGILRGEEFFANPKPDLAIQRGDTLTLIGTSTQLGQFKAFVSHQITLDDGLR